MVNKSCIHRVVLLIIFLVSTGVVLCDDEETGFGSLLEAAFDNEGAVPFIDNDPHINGTWSPVADWPIVPIHMVLLKTGKILSYGTNPQGQGTYLLYTLTTLTH